MSNDSSRIFHSWFRFHSISFVQCAWCVSHFSVLCSPFFSALLYSRCCFFFFAFLILENDKSVNTSALQHVLMFYFLTPTEKNKIKSEEGAKEFCRSLFVPIFLLLLLIVVYLLRYVCMFLVFSGCVCVWHWLCLLLLRHSAIQLFME